MKAYYIEVKGSEIHEASFDYEVFYRDITVMYIVVAETRGKAKYRVICWATDVEWTDPIHIRKIADDIDLPAKLYESKMFEDEYDETEKMLWDLAWPPQTEEEIEASLAAFELEEKLLNEGDRLYGNLEDSTES